MGWDELGLTHVSRAAAAVGDIFVFWGVMSCHIGCISKHLTARSGYRLYVCRNSNCIVAALANRDSWTTPTQAARLKRR